MLITITGVRNDIFGGLVHDPQETVDLFVAYETSIERGLAASASHFQRFANVSATYPTAHSHTNIDPVDINNLEETNWAVALEELRKVLSSFARPALLSIAVVARDQVQ